MVTYAIGKSRLQQTKERAAASEAKQRQSTISEIKRMQERGVTTGAAAPQQLERLEAQQADYEVQQKQVVVEPPKVVEQPVVSKPADLKTGKSEAPLEFLDKEKYLREKAYRETLAREVNLRQTLPTGEFYQQFVAPKEEIQRVLRKQVGEKESRIKALVEKYGLSAEPTPEGVIDLGKLKSNKPGVSDVEVASASEEINVLYGEVEFLKTKGYVEPAPPEKTKEQLIAEEFGFKPVRQEPLSRFAYAYEVKQAEYEKALQGFVGPAKGKEVEIKSIDIETGKPTVIKVPQMNVAFEAPMFVYGYIKGAAKVGALASDIPYFVSNKRSQVATGIISEATKTIPTISEPLAPLKYSGEMLGSIIEEPGASVGEIYGFGKSFGVFVSTPVGRISKNVFMSSMAKAKEIKMETIKVKEFETPGKVGATSGENIVPRVVAKMPDGTKIGVTFGFDIHTGKVLYDVPLNKLLESTEANKGIKQFYGKVAESPAPITRISKAGEKTLLTKSPVKHQAGSFGEDYFAVATKEIKAQIAKQAKYKADVEIVVSRQFSSALAKTGEYGTEYTLFPKRTATVELIKQEVVSPVFDKTPQRVLIRKELQSKKYSGKLALTEESLAKFTEEPQLARIQQGITNVGKTRGTTSTALFDALFTGFYDVKALPLIGKLAEKPGRIYKPAKILEAGWEVSGLGREWKNIKILETKSGIPVGRPPKETKIVQRPTVKLILEDKQGKILLTEERFGQFSLPGGGIEPRLEANYYGMRGPYKRGGSRWIREEAIKALESETAFEISIKPYRIKKVSTAKGEPYVSNEGLLQQDIPVFYKSKLLPTQIPKIGEAAFSKGEIKSLKWVSPEEAIAMPELDLGIKKGIAKAYNLDFKQAKLKTKTPKIIESFKQIPKESYHAPKEKSILTETKYLNLKTEESRIKKSNETNNYYLKRDYSPQKIKETYLNYTPVELKSYESKINFEEKPKAVSYSKSIYEREYGKGFVGEPKTYEPETEIKTPEPYKPEYKETTSYIPKPYKYQKPYAYPKPKLIETPKIFPRKSFKYLGKKQEKELGFKAQVKRKGKWIFVGGIQPKSTALRIGSGTAMQTSARSFRITPTREFIPKTGEMLPNLYQFRPQILKGRKIKGVFVERSKYAIREPREFKEITLKGLKTIKSKRFKLL